MDLNEEKKKHKPIKLNINDMINASEPTVAIDMSAWPEDEEFGPWFKVWIKKWEVNFID